MKKKLMKSWMGKMTPLPLRNEPPPPFATLTRHPHPHQQHQYLSAPNEYTHIRYDVRVSEHTITNGFASEKANDESKKKKENQNNMKRA